MEGDDSVHSYADMLIKELERDLKRVEWKKTLQAIGNQAMFAISTMYIGNTYNIPSNYTNEN